MSTNIFDDYRVQLQQALKDAGYPESQCKLPRFCSTASAESPYLALLQDPGNSGAVDSQECSVDNNDGTSKNQIKIIGKAGVDRNEIVFWNFYAAYDCKSRSKKAKQFWGSQLDNLLKLLPNIKAVVVYGKDARDGVCAYYQYQPALNDPEQLIKPIHGRDILFRFSPHPSQKNSLNFDDPEDIINLGAAAWKAAKQFVNPNI